MLINTTMLFSPVQITGVLATALRMAVYAVALPFWAILVPLGW